MANKFKIFAGQHKNSLSHCKDIWKNDQGSLSLIALPIIPIILLVFLTMVATALKSHQQIIEKGQQYLCYHHLTSMTSKQIKNISHLNKSIASAYLLMLSPATAVEAKIVHQSLIKTQTMMHVSFLKNMTNSRYCQFSQSIFFISNYPYRRQSRHPDGTLKPEFKKWSVKVPPQNLTSSESFMLIGSFQIRDHLSSSITLQTSEKQLKLALSSSN